MKLKICSLMIALSLLGGCSYRPQVGPFWQQDWIQQAPAGPPKFQMGWRDGCETGISVTGNLMMKQLYHFKQNSTLARDKVYYTGWKLAYNQCERYTFQYLRREYF